MELIDGIKAIYRYVLLRRANRLRVPYHLVKVKANVTERNVNRMFCTVVSILHTPSLSGNAPQLSFLCPGLKDDGPMVVFPQQEYFSKLRPLRLVEHLLASSCKVFTYLFEYHHAEMSVLDLF